MAKLVTDKARTPFYYSRNRFLKNYPAVIGLIIILLSIVVALLGYLIMPDSTPNANDGAIQIQKQLPGFKVMVLKSRKSIEVEHVNF